MKLIAVVLLIIGVAILTLLFLFTQLKKKGGDSKGLGSEKKHKKSKKEKIDIKEDRELKKVEKISNNTRVKKKDDVNPQTETLTTLLDSEDVSPGEYRSELLSEDEIKDTDEDIIKDILFESGSLAPDGEILDVKISGMGILNIEDRTELLEDVENNSFDSSDEDGHTQLLYDEEFSLEDFAPPEQSGEAPEEKTESEVIKEPEKPEPVLPEDAQDSVPENISIVEEEPSAKEVPKPISPTASKESPSSTDAAPKKQFVGETLSGGDFTIEEGMTLVNCMISNLDLAETTVSGLKIIGSVLEDISFLGADLSGLICTDTTLNRCNLKFASLNNAMLSDVMAVTCNMEKTEFDNSLLNSVKFKDCKLNSKTSFEGAVIKSSVIDNIEELNLSNATII